MILDALRGAGQEGFEATLLFFFQRVGGAAEQVGNNIDDFK